MSWYYVQDGEQVGPVSMEELVARVRSGQVSSSGLVWQAGMANWVPASTVPELGVASPESAGPAQSAPPPTQPAPLPVSVLGYHTPSGVLASARCLEMLRQTKPWVRLMSVVTFIIAGLFLVGGCVMGIVLGAATSGRGGGGPPAAVLIIVYVALGCLYFAPGLYLSRYASHIGTLLRSNDPRYLENALQAQKSFWKFVGILTAVVLCIYGAIFLFALGISGLAMFR